MLVQSNMFRWLTSTADLQWCALTANRDCGEMESWPIRFDDDDEEYAPDIAAESEVSIPDWFEFRRLISQWHNERGATSSISKMAMCPSYQRLIANGQRFLPLILRQMESEGDEPDQWFWALHAITGADPITEDMRGDIVQMSRAWLNWARNNYAW